MSTMTVKLTIIFEVLGGWSASSVVRPNFDLHNPIWLYTLYNEDTLYLLTCLVTVADSSSQLLVVCDSDLVINWGIQKHSCRSAMFIIARCQRDWLSIIINLQMYKNYNFPNLCKQFLCKQCVTWYETHCQHNRWAWAKYDFVRHFGELGWTKENLLTDIPVDIRYQVEGAFTDSGSEESITRTVPLLVRDSDRDQLDLPLHFSFVGPVLHCTLHSSIRWNCFEGPSLSKWGY